MFALLPKQKQKNTRLIVFTKCKYLTHNCTNDLNFTKRMHEPSRSFYSACK